ncbi:37S ribosomal protein Rsm25, partial [Rhizodiscina lignyota]
MGKHRFAPQRVLRAADQLLETKRLTHRPPWYLSLERIPPQQILIRPAKQRPIGDEKEAHGQWYKPKRIAYPEDKLRSEFFGDHPWELARPKVILEGTGNDGKRWNWGWGIDQPGKVLDGESVVQRQLYLMRHHNMTKAAAYDVARREFYDKRHEQEIERRVAKEEALHYGAYFGKSTLEIGEELEDAVWEKWKERAMEHLAQVEVQRAQTVTYSSDEDED